MIKKVFILVFMIILLTACGKYSEYKTSFNAFSSDIKITLYEKNKKRADLALEDIEKIYLKYDDLLDQYNNLEVSKELENVLNIIIDYSKKTKYVNFNSKIKDNKIINKNDNLKTYIVGLANNEVYEYLKDKGISKFFINLNGYVLAGYPNNKDNFLVGISSPFDDSVIKMLELKDKYVVTKNINEVSSDKLKDGNVSITLITNDTKMGDFIAFDLLLMPTNESIKYIKNNDIKAILCYYKNESEKIYTNID